ncbi:MAG: hypothetical protein JRH11_00160 [Deltaproteobacteria bacterium]|nr:hypothetical protein [Deltaproteobacteria bacterium]
MVEALPEWLTMVLGGLICLAMPFFLFWMLWELWRTARGIAKGLAGGPGGACQELGLTVTTQGALSGLAEGLFEGRAVRVSWVVGYQHGYDPRYQVTRVAAAVTPPLGVGLEATEGGAAKDGIGWPEFEEHMAVSATDAAGARAALGRAGAALWSVLGGPGEVVVDDTAVTVVLPGVGADRAELEAALRRATTAALALSTG